MISLGSVLRSTRHANMPRFLSQVAGDGVTKVSEQFPGVMNFPGKSHHVLLSPSKRIGNTYVDVISENVILISDAFLIPGVISS
ncbi:hypothetical protein OIU77_018447 [Salix suchowensis]|uniref:Uncharacterized protein n=1 Tax=Salix suchowensis TaxID=1278906 RepID=A0ABQ9CFY6_9ROSI|nr:hypothetical protein OIU77_018447 [Salix suchowensis]